MDAIPKLQITLRPIDSLTPHPDNPRRHSASQIRRLAQSFRKLGFNGAILADRDGTVVAGHACLEACRTLGWSDVPTIQLDHLTPRQAVKFMIAHNKFGELSSWDDDLLAKHLKELTIELDFEPEVIGFDVGEIDFRIEGLATADADAADVVPEPLTLTPISQPGDLWVMREHRVLCGNALEDVAYLTLMDGRLAVTVVADCPYNVRVHGHVSGLGAIRHREFAMASGEMTREEFIQFLRTAFRLMVRHSVDGSIHFQFMDWRHCFEILTAAEKVYTELKNLCTWIKDNPGLGSFYRSQTELVFVFKAGKAPHVNTVQLGRFGRSRTNAWHYPSPSAFARKSDEGTLLEMHPTVKPVRLVADAILDCSARGDIVLDPFLGSGTTLIAAERVGRVCYGMEIDPLYVDTAVRRWQTYAGEQARHAGTGKTFDEIAHERSAGHV